MFTGIITDVGTINATEMRGDLHLRIACGYDTSGIDIGASIACSGACMTVVELGADWFAVDISQESVSRTAPGRWEVGRRLNLERSLKVGDELGGHIVTGHVDGVGTIASIATEGDSVRLEIRAPAELAPYLAPKGSIAVDGISLTVNSVTDQPDGSALFGLNIIPHTSAVTTLGTMAIHDGVNLEIDVLARYLGRMEQLRSITRR
ncbi:MULTISPECIES: riboflavin synthase [unclassified Sphingomonas]|uniref:riboflavin synthase n=1 Tax=unclassified Sphingomonas TaxID=196159 RepID=UPI0006F9D088|nr:MULTISPECIES: riboflavin synthase [unclassified Sphingomonas]KQX20867.1 riboflavin synthase subunit alpha [Sphingomonas sp. Root1294]KQY68713.1 riboflavin synthase subunit alpha [Sphingomonas sp. Root50]